MNNVTGSPIADPSVTVGVDTYSLRYSLLAEYKISEAGLNPGDMVRTLSPTSQDPKRFFYIQQLFAACVAHNFAAKSKPAPTAEEWSYRLTQLEPDEDKLRLILGQIGVAVIEAILKRIPAPAKAQGTPEQHEPTLAN